MQFSNNPKTVEAEFFILNTFVSKEDKERMSNLRGMRLKMLDLFFQGPLCNTL